MWLLSGQVNCSHLLHPGEEGSFHTLLPTLYSRGQQAVLSTFYSQISPRCDRKRLATVTWIIIADQQTLPLWLQLKQTKGQPKPAVYMGNQYVKHIRSNSIFHLDNDHNFQNSHTYITYHYEAVWYDAGVLRSYVLNIYLVYPIIPQPF